MDDIDNAQGRETSGPARVLRVLVVDGDLGHRKLLCALVGRFGDEAIEAGDGQEGLDKAQRLRPDMVITASRTSGLSGIELIRALRDSPEVPPYILIGLQPDEQGDLAAAIASGADDWITKPISQEAVLARLQIGRRIILTQSENERLADRLRRYSEELAQLHGRVRRLSQTDDLTGLPNWSYANRHLKELWPAPEGEPSPLACLIIDIDGFRKLNYACGRERGNEVLKSVAAAITGALAGKQMVCRFGGDRFLVICPDTPLEAAMALGRLLLERVKALGIEVAGEPLGISIGVAERRMGAMGPVELLYLAERGMYRAKYNGRNRVVSGHNFPGPREAPPGEHFLGAA